ncbi:V-type ATP synthase subunit D [Candidatus Woesearchaeota archaeon]|nr:V-type ATP synthase subunit D [Candidatus Woesearchaeota archaeon]
MSVKPTRMGLLLTKKKLKLASKGYKLLKEKRDALVMEFFKVLKEIKALRKDVAQNVSDAQKSLFRAQAAQGVASIDRLTFGLSQEAHIEVKQRSIMGVKVPDIKKVETSSEWFTALDSSPELDSSVVKYREAFPSLIRLVEKQLVLQRLADEIQKTKRKVNSLEYLIIPSLEGIKSMINFKLEEREREDFTRLKKIKEKIK